MPMKFFRIIANNDITGEVEIHFGIMENGAIHCSHQVDHMTNMEWEFDVEELMLLPVLSEPSPN